MAIGGLIDALNRHSAKWPAQPPADTRSRSAEAAAALRTIANVLVIALLAELAFRNTERFLSAPTPNTAAMVIINGLFLGLFLWRRDAKTETTSPGLWLLGYAGTMLPLMMRASRHPGQGMAGFIVEFAGLAMLIIALLSLRRSFAVVPANRGVRDDGFYRLVRHPVYLSELTLLLGVVIANPTPWNTLLWLAECGLQFARAVAEERHLAADMRYRAYCERVRYRLIPSIL